MRCPYCKKPKDKCCCEKTEEKPDFFAQYSVLASPPSRSDLPFRPVFQKGESIHLDGETEIALKAGYLYLIDYIFLATPEAGGYFEIVPRINGSLRLLYAFFAPAGSERNASASGSFTTNEAASEDITLSFNLTYPDTVRNIDISGAVSVTPLMKI